MELSLEVTKLKILAFKTRTVWQAFRCTVPEFRMDFYGGGTDLGVKSLLALSEAIKLHESPRLDVGRKEKRSPLLPVPAPYLGYSTFVRRYRNPLF